MLEEWSASSSHTIKQLSLNINQAFRDRYWPAILAAMGDESSSARPDAATIRVSAQDAYRGIMARKGGDPETRDAGLPETEKERVFVERAGAKYEFFLKTRGEFDVVDLSSNLQRRWKKTNGQLWGGFDVAQEDGV